MVSQGGKGGLQEKSLQSGRATASLAKEEKREPTAGTSIAPAPSPKIAHLPDLQNALKFYIHTRFTRIRPSVKKCDC
eukprot:1138241-Pelagomonas_calceolata.AAC.3